MNGSSDRFRESMVWVVCGVLIPSGSLLQAHHSSAPFYDNSREVESKARSRKCSGRTRTSVSRCATMMVGIGTLKPLRSPY